MGYLTELEKMVLQRTFFLQNLETFLRFFLNNKTRKLDVAESNPVMENFPSVLYLSLSLSFFGDVALQPLICGVMLSYIILINAQL